MARPETVAFCWNAIVLHEQKGDVATCSGVQVEVLCSRVGIVAAGKLACLGTPQRLKSLYGGEHRGTRVIDTVRNCCSSRLQNNYTHPESHQRCSPAAGSYLLEVFGADDTAAQAQIAAFAATELGAAPAEVLMTSHHTCVSYMRRLHSM